MSERAGGRHPGQWPVEHRLNSFNESGGVTWSLPLTLLNDIASELYNIVRPYIRMSQSLPIDVDVRPNLDVWANCNIMLSRGLPRDDIFEQASHSLR